jgi:hypothetical protein
LLSFRVGADICDHVVDGVAVVIYVKENFYFKKKASQGFGIVLYLIPAVPSAWIALPPLRELFCLSGCHLVLILVITTLDFNHQLLITSSIRLSLLGVIPLNLNMVTR